MQNVGTTGTASCFDIQNTNIGIEYDGVPGSDSMDIFWEILPEDDWILPAASSVTFHVVIDWQPECSDELAVVGSNLVRATYANGPDGEAAGNIFCRCPGVAVSGCGAATCFDITNLLLYLGVCPILMNIPSLGSKPR